MLVLHRSERADVLAEMLADLLIEPLEDPMARELVSVPTRGVERWLTQQLSGRLGSRNGRADGVCANVEFPFPGVVVRRILAGGGREAPESDRWAPERLAWPLSEVVAKYLDEPWLAPFAEHLRAGGADGRLSAVRHLADLYDRYGVHRPDLLLSWARGEEGGIAPATAWQAELWRRLRGEIGEPSPAEQLRERCALLRKGEVDLAIPERVALFGLTRLPGSHLEVLSALAAVRDVHLFLLHPSPSLWGRLEEMTLPPLGLLRRDDTTGDLVRNPLLASWGRDAREMQLVLSRVAPGRSEHRLVGAAPESLLQQIQHDIRHDVRPPGAPLSGRVDERLVLDAADESVQLHACHGRARQVEVARDAVLHLLATKPDIEPRDVILLCPDVEAFAPLVDAAVSCAPDGGVEAGTSLPRLSVRVADRSLRQTNPLLELAASLLELATARVTASEVIDLAARAPVRRRFGLGDEDLRRLERFVTTSGIRWGLDAAHREPFGLGAVPANTWGAGLDRLALGATMAEDAGRRFCDVLPVDDVPAGDLRLVGRLSELVDRLGEASDALAAPKPLEAWCAALMAAVGACGATSDADSWQWAQLGGVLAEVLAEATGPDGPSEMELSRSEVAELLSERLQGRPTRANFRTGEVTLCTLVPMRAVPHRVVCLLGIDDGVFPRSAPRDGDDLLAADPRVGERDPRSEERQLLLDALLAATEHLIVTYSGRDERTNSERPPSVPVGELLEAIDRTAVASDGSSAVDAVLVRHPLQSFDGRNFAVGALRPGRPFGFDPTNFDGAKALRGERREPSAFLGEPLPTPDCSTIELGDLERFLRHPVGAFLRTRLGFVPSEAEDPLEDGLPVELDGLASFAVGERLLAALLAGVDPEEAAAAERASGFLPPGALADAVLAPILRTVTRIVEACEIDAPATVVPIDVLLGSGTRLVGAVGDLHDETLRRASYARLSGNSRLLSWVHLLALSATAPERPFAAVTVGRIRRPDPNSQAEVSIARVPPLGATPAARKEQAQVFLEVLVDLYRRGVCEPLPLYPKTSLSWAEAAHRGAQPAGAARLAWEGGYQIRGEAADPRHRLVHGGAVAFEVLSRASPRADETGEGWPVGEASRLGRYARRLFGDLLAHERVEDR